MNQVVSEAIELYITSTEVTIDKLYNITKTIENIEYSAKDEHPDRFELNSAAAQIEQSNRRN